MGKQVDAGFMWGCSSVGRAPALQAGGQEFESLHLHSVRRKRRIRIPFVPRTYLENRILKRKIDRNIKTSEVLQESEDSGNQNKQLFVNNLDQGCNAMHLR